MFAFLIQLITKKQRTRVRVGVDFEWSDSSWTHNFFRACELICGRKYGIRAEMSCDFYDGKVVYACHSFESVISFIEMSIRKTFAWRPVKIWVPVLQTAGMPVFASPYIFAIALDTSQGASEATGTSVTYSYTCTGSNLTLFVGSRVSGGVSTSGVTYSGASATIVNTEQSQAGGGGPYMISLWIKVGPATGANNIIVSTGSSATIRSSAASYSGTKQSGQPDSSNSVSWTSTTTITATTTVVATGCWMVACGYALGGTLSGSGGSAIRSTNPDGGAFGFFDSNGTVGTGSQNLTITDSASETGKGVVASFAPAGGGATTPPFLSLLGVGL